MAASPKVATPKSARKIPTADRFLSKGKQVKCGWLTLNILSSILVVSSVLGTVLLSLPGFDQNTGLIAVFTDIEVIASTFFFFEYFLRLFVHRKRCCAYATSFLGVIDLLVCIVAIPTLYERFVAKLPAFNFHTKPGTFPQTHTFQVLSCFRMLRVLKLLQFVKEYQTLTLALHQELRMIVVFLFAVLTVVLILGTCFWVAYSLYAAERFGNPDSPFNSIPVGMWWAAVTLTTVGYGDLVPQTWMGKVFAFISMLLGYGLLAVPTIVGTLEISQLSKLRELREREATGTSSSYFKSSELQEPLLADADMIHFRARAADFDSKGHLRLSAGYTLLEEVICLWVEKNFQNGVLSGKAVEHYFSVVQPLASPVGRQLLCKVEVEEMETGIDIERRFLVALFTADIPTCKVAEGYIRYG
eukprot:Skav231759  [mRNA]  locus=scaffold695:105333:107021:- [translate_table: standard]